ncbi:Zinc finger CCHC-type [Arabidopsis suecica]|uniref:Zinc finger CCHC-type n=1 Tax=Arabidopsis suecica TaxID=45249 RepID=A0A8T1XQG3_ARASU|nr:Zinc finger CCHC-type [Arabidopsis suecica]
MQMPSRHTRLRGGRPWGFLSSAGPSNNPYGNNDGSSDDSMIPSEHVRRMLEGSESESFMATSPSVTSVESIPTREMEGSDSSVENDPSEDLDEFEDDDVETSAESEEFVPLVALGGSFGKVPITDFVVLSDDSDGDSSEESEEQMATGFLFGDSDIDEPMWEGPNEVLYEFNSDDSWQPGVHANPYYYPPTPDSLLTLDSQALAYNMVSPDVKFATPPSPPTSNFVEISSDSELSDADELGNGVPFSNSVKSEPLRMSLSPRIFASRTWYDGYDGANSTLGIEPIRPPKGMSVWNESIRRSADGTVVTELEHEDGRRSEPYSVTPFCFTCGQDGHYTRACPYVRHYHPYARPYVICYECGGEGHYATVCPRKRPENPGPSSPSPSTSAKKKKNLSIN